MNIKMNIKIFILSLFFAVNVNAWSLDDKSLLDDRLLPSISPSIWLDPCWALMSPGPCEDNLVAWWKDEWSDDGTQLLDLSTSATHEAMQGQSLLFSGAQYGTVDLTDYEHLNEEVWTIEFEFHNSVAINATYTGRVAVQVDDKGTSNGVAFGSATSYLTDEIISVASGAATGRSGWTSPTESISVGKHLVKIQWDGSGYEIWLDGVQKNNATSGTQELLLLNRLILGARGDLATFLNNTALYNITLKREDGTVIWQNYLAGGPDATDTELSVVGPDVSLVGFTWPGDRIQSALYGSKKHNELGYSVGVTDGVELWVNPNTETIDASNYSTFDTETGIGRIVSDGTTVELRVPGTLTTGLVYKFIYVEESGSTGNVRVVSSSPIYDLDSGSETVNLTAATSNLIIWNDGACDVTFTLSVQYAPQGYIPASLTTPSQDIYGNALTYSGRAAQPLDVFGYVPTFAGSETLTLAHLTGSETVTSSTGTSTVAVVAGGLTFTAGTVGRVVLSDGSDLIFESGSLLTGTTVYNIDGTGRHGTIVGGTTPIFDTLFQPSYLAQYGGEVSGQNIIPYPLGTNTFSGVHDAPEDTFAVEVAVASVEIEEADLRGFWINKTTGAANSVDPYDVEWIPDYQFSNDTDILLYSTDVTETCDRRTEQYMSIPFPGTIKLIDAADDYILDNAGNYIIQ